MNEWIIERKRVGLEIIIWVINRVRKKEVKIVEITEKYWECKRNNNWMS